MPKQHRGLYDANRILWTNKKYFEAFFRKKNAFFNFFCKIQVSLNYIIYKQPYHSFLNYIQFRKPNARCTEN